MRVKNGRSSGATRRSTRRADSSRSVPCIRVIFLDDLLRAQRDDLGRAAAEALQDLVGVFADEWRPSAIGARGLGQVDRGRRQRQRAGDAGKLALGEKPGIADMRLVERLLR